MICKAQVLGVKNIKNREGSEKKFDFNVLRVIDVENPDSEIEELSLHANEVAAMNAHVGKVVHINVMKTGKYLNFGGIYKTA